MLFAVDVCGGSSFLCPTDMLLPPFLFVYLNLGEEIWELPSRWTDIQHPTGRYDRVPISIHLTVTSAKQPVLLPPSPRPGLVDAPPMNCNVDLNSGGVRQKHEIDTHSP